MITFIKDPDAVLDYTVDWSPWLSDSGDQITSSAWIVPEGLTTTADYYTTTTATVWLSGGTVGREYVVTNRITTAAGRVDDRSFTLVIRSR
jgi:hypothetical protein